MTFEEFIKEFFRITDNIQGEYLGPAHLAVAGVITAVILFLGFFIGFKKRQSSFKEKLKVLRIATVVMLCFEFGHYLNVILQTLSFIYIVKYELPLFLCDILVFMMPIASFSKGKIQKSALSYIVCLGILSMVMGAWFNGFLFAHNPIWSGRCIWTFTNHCIPGFAAIFILVSGMTELRFKDIGITYLCIVPFVVASLVLDCVYPTNYMFLNESGGTPFFLFENLAGGNIHIYRVLVILGMAAYIAAFYGMYELISYLVRKKKQGQKENKAA